MTVGSPVSKRLSEQLAPEMQELIYRPRLETEIATGFGHITDLNQAHLLMLVAQGLVPLSIGRKLARALIDLEQAGPSAISLNTALEDAHYNFETKLMEMAGPDAGGRIHIGRSRNDMGATIDRMRARSYWVDICTQLNTLREGALEQAAAHVNVVMPGYTHLQVAQPITLGFYCLGIERALSRDAGRLLGSYDNINRSPMGAAAFAGTSFAIDRPLVAELLGFAAPLDHALDSVASRDFMIELGAACTGLGITWSRLAQDLYVWATDEFGLIEFPDRIAGSSSIMPQKKNLVVLEHLKATSAQNIGDLVSMLSTMRSSHFTNSIDGVRAAVKGGWQLLETTLNSLILAALAMRSFQPLPHVMLQRVLQSFATITGLAELLVQKQDVSFRDAHHICGNVVKLALARHRDVQLIDVELVDEAARMIIGRPLGCSAADLAAVLDPRQSVESRTSAGGPSSAEMLRLLEVAKHDLSRDMSTVRQHQQARDNARARLKAEIARLASD